MRFRTVEDEKVYNALRIEVFLRLGTYLPPIVMNEVLRNFGKIEGLLYGEGIRQGMAVASLAKLLAVIDEDRRLEDMPAIVAHASFYGDATTPLVRVETQHLLAATQKVGIDIVAVEDTWLDASPLPFAPQTLAEAQKLYGPELEPAPVGRQRAAPAAVPASIVVPEEVPEPFAVAPNEASDPDPDPADPLMTRDASPDFLDRVRDELQHMLKSGFEPKTWAELILGLHQRMQVDAFALDMQLAGDLGRTMLAQCGLFNIAPGAGVMTGADGNIKFVGGFDELLRDA